MNVDFYLIKKGKEYDLIAAQKDSDPLHGRGSWSVEAGPFDTFKEANEHYRLFIEGAQLPDVASFRPTREDERILRRIRTHTLLTVHVDPNMSQIIRAALAAWESIHPREKKGE